MVEMHLPCPICRSSLRGGVTHWHFICSACQHEVSAGGPVVDKTPRPIVVNRVSVNEYVAHLVADFVGFDGQRLIDVGCGSGELVTAAEKRGWDAIGVDIDPNRRQRHLDSSKFRVGTIRDIVQQFAAITYVDVLEHINDVRSELIAARERLARTGAVFILTPCADGIVYRIAKILYRFNAPILFRAFWNIGYPYPHQHLFSRRSLANLAGECGYDVVRTLFRTGFPRIDRLLIRVNPGWAFHCLRLASLSTVMILRIRD